MNREILFRGKTYDGQWIYGNLLVKGSFCYIIGTDDSRAVEVIPSSVGQYTGMKDKDGNKIFDGDVYENTQGVMLKRGYQEVVYRSSSACFVVQSAIHHGKTEPRNVYEYPSAVSLYTFLANEPYKRMGNVYDNPELIKNN